jgi:hypothetical protein
MNLTTSFLPTQTTGAGALPPSPLPAASPSPFEEDIPVNLIELLNEIQTGNQSSAKEVSNVQREILKCMGLI